MEPLHPRPRFPFLRKGKASVKEIVACEWEIADYVYEDPHKMQHTHSAHTKESYYLEVDGQRVSKIRSPTFWHTGTSEWYMELCETEGALLLLFHLVSSQRHPSVKAVVQASMLFDNGEIDAVCNETINLIAPQTLKGNVYFEKECKLIGEVSISAEATDTLAQNPSNAVDQLVINLEALLESEYFSDLTICTGETEVRAHSALLFARSPAFAEILIKDSRKTHTAKLDVQDLEAETLREVLRYIYTAKAPRIGDMADKLLVAADRYHLPKLKEMCEVELARKLCVVNAAAIAVLAMTHGCHFLKRSVIAFIKKNVVDVLGSDGWAEATTHSTQIVVDINRLIAGKYVDKI